MKLSIIFHFNSLNALLDYHDWLNSKWPEFDSLHNQIICSYNKLAHLIVRHDHGHK